MLVNRLESCEWRVEFILASNSLQNPNVPSVQLKLNVIADKTLESSLKQEEKGEAAAGSDEGEGEKVVPFAFGVDADKLRVFLHELKQARALMERF